LQKKKKPLSQTPRQAKKRIQTAKILRGIKITALQNFVTNLVTL
jgi:hypothetical protein